MAVFPNDVVWGYLLDSASIFTAELYAILIALLHITCMSPSAFVIISNSLGALQVIKQFDSPHPLVLHIQLWLHRVASKNWSHRP